MKLLSRGVDAKPPSLIASISSRASSGRPACTCAQASAGRQPGGAIWRASRSKNGACGPSSPRSLRSESVLVPWNWAWIGESSRPSASSRSPRSNISRAIRAPRS